MSFGQSISHVLSNMTNFSGRASRSEYWWWILAIVIVQVIANALDSMLFGGDGGGWAIGFISWVVGVLVFLATLAVAIRRLHDTGKSGWFILLGLIPFVGGIILLVFYLLPSEGPNQWGTGPAVASAV